MKSEFTALVLKKISDAAQNGPLSGPLKRPLLTGVHWAARQALTQAGFKWELRRSGELQLGLWRKTLRKIPSSTSKKAQPKRFVMIPGFGDTPISWLPVMIMMNPVLRSKFDEIVMFDFPGFGGFLADKTCFPTMDLLLEHVQDCLDTLQPHTILGHSLGGWLAAYYGASCGRGERPLKLKTNPRKYSGPERLILADPSGAFGAPGRREMWKAIFDEAIEYGFEKFRPRVFLREPFWFRFVLREFGNFMSREDVVAFMRSIHDGHLVEDKLCDIKAKIWLLWGDKDILCPFEWAPAWQARIPSGAPIVALKDCGHSPQIERPAATAAAISHMLYDKIPHKLGTFWWKVSE